MTKAKALSAAAIASTATVAAGQRCSQGVTSVHALVPGAGARAATAAGRQDGQQPGKDDARSVGSKSADGGLAFWAKGGTAHLADGGDGLSDGADVRMGSARAGLYEQAGLSGRQHSGAMQRWLHSVTHWGLGGSAKEGG